MIERVVEDDPAHLAEYARIPIGFSVTEVFGDEALAALLHGGRSSPRSPTDSVSAPPR